MALKRPRIEGYAVISREGMIARNDGSFPDEIKIEADHKFYQDSVDRASAVANGRHSAEGGPKEKTRRRIILTRRVQRVMVDPNNALAVLWNPGTAPLEEAWQRLGIEDGTLAVVGGTDAFFLTRAEASVPRGRPVFPGVGKDVPPSEIFTKHGMVLRDTRTLDAATNTVLEEWGPK